ncbi:MAG: hypothetical protein ABIP03_11260, partial [Aquihabitans sp.]
MAVVPDLSRPTRARVPSLDRLAVGLGLALLLTTAAIGLAGPSSATPTRSFSVSALSIGSDTAPASTSGSVSTTAPGSARPLAGTAPDDSGASAADDRKVWAVVAGLVIVALGLSLLTIRYWRQTRPVAAGSRRSPGRHVREAGDEMVDLDDGSLLFGDLTRGGSTIASQPEAAPDLTAEAIVEDAPVGRADPGVQSDHARADADWEPHTEELERVDVAVPLPTSDSNEPIPSVASNETARPSRD